MNANTCRINRQCYKIYKNVYVVFSVRLTYIILFSKCLHTQSFRVNALLTRCSHLDPTPDPAAPGVSACSHEVTSCLLIRSRHRLRPRQEKLTSRRTHFTLLVKLRGREACFLSHFLQTHVSGEIREQRAVHLRSVITALRLQLCSYFPSLSPFPLSLNQIYTPDSQGSSLRLQPTNLL